MIGLRKDEKESCEGTEEVAEDLDGAKVLGHDLIEHRVEFGHVHSVDGGLDAKPLFAMPTLQVA